MNASQSSHLFVDASPRFIYDLLLDRSALEPLTRRSIGKTTYVCGGTESEDPAFVWTYEFCGVSLSVTGSFEIDEPGRELGLRLAGDFSAFIRWQFTPYGPGTMITLSIDYHFPDGIIGLLSEGFIERQVSFEQTLILKNLQQIVARRLPEADPAAVRDGQLAR